MTYKFDIKPHESSHVTEGISAKKSTHFDLKKEEKKKVYVQITLL